MENGGETELETPTSQLVGIGKNAEEQSVSSSRLSGRWLKLFRYLWLAMALYTVGLLIVSLPAYFERNQIMKSLGVTAISLVCLLVSALICWRKSSDRMALFTAYTLLGLSGAFFSDLYDPWFSMNPIWTWLYNGISAALGPTFFLFFYLFPDGRFVPRWTRLLVPLVVLFSLVSNFRLEVATRSLGAVPFLVLGGGFAIQVYRYRRVSTPLQRLQTKWVVYGLSLAIAFLVVGIGSFEMLPDIAAANEQVANLLIFLGFLLIPLSIGIAILRYRLYDIDLIIRRTLQYTLLTGLLLIVYFGCILVLQNLFENLTGQQSPIVIVISTLTIAALFNPLRLRVQAFIDLRFYRRKYDAEQALARFAATTRDGVDLDDLQNQILTVVGDTLQPEHVSLWLRRSGDL